GVFVGGGSYAKTFIQGNNIASNATFGIELGASEGDFVGTLSDLTIGGSSSGEGNTIASNAYDGIGIIGRVLLGSNYGGTRVQGNTIRFNFANGVNINRMAFGAGFTGLLLGGGPGEGNTITNNGDDGVQVNAGIYAFTTVEGNTIASNGRNGVNFYAPYGQRLTGLGLGGTGAGKGNTINDNAGSGLAASKGNYALTTVAGNTFRGNRIGISLIDTKNLTIGGPLAAATNMVGDNTDAGLAATGDLTGTQVLGNAFTSTRGSSVSLADVSGLIFGQTVSGAGNTLSGGEVGLVATGMMGGTSVTGNTFTGQSVGIRLQNASGDSADKPFLIGGATDAVNKFAATSARVAITGSFAAVRLAPVVAPTLVVAYSDAPQDLAESLGFVPTDQGANVALLTPFDQVVWERTVKADALTYVAPAQAAVDCLTRNGRMPAEGDAVLQWMTEDENTWRLSTLPEPAAVDER
ncbi:MAG: right-handed parallel beta-helix repeat-containing protein, partial [Actinomycetota bacterium]